MKVTQEKLPDSQVGLDIEISSEVSKSAYEKVVRQYAQTANIPGFRRGKVPRTVLIQRLGVNRIKAAALDSLMQDHLPKAIEQEDIPAVGEIEFRGNIDELIEQYQPGEPLVIRAKVDVEPEVQLGQYQDLKVQAEEVKYDPAQVDEMLKQEQVKQATLIPVEDRGAQEGDVVFVDFAGQFVSDDPEAEPEEVPGGAAENFRVELEPGQFIPGFTEGIVGMELGETKKLELQFPEDYSSEEMAGRGVKFSITLNEIKERELPELDDEFAEEISEFKTIAELREFLEKDYQEKAETRTTDNKHTVLLQAVVEAMTLELPETMIRQEIDQIVTQQAIQLSEMGIDVKRMLSPEIISGMRAEAKPKAVERLKQSLALKEIARRENIAAEESEIQEEEAKALKMLEGQAIDPQRLRSYVTEDLLKKKTLTWLEDNSTIELVPEGTLTPIKSEDEAGELVEPNLDLDAEKDESTQPLTGETVEPETDQPSSSAVPEEE
ncbi:MAG: trigger factor [Oscillatoriales cyanobacterium RM2_1_1]|nr:trigger factor [Oscillatoriales cyanobacterium SM2_3_0]NJO46328.1 trigger factor [Oscillatoriales cyanobacterium RM2_1_1]